MIPNTNRWPALLALAVLPLALASCDDSVRSELVGPAALETELDAGRERAGSGDLSVLTWNVYYGADLNVLLEPTEFLPGQVAAVFGRVQATKAHERAATMAELISHSPPDLIGLQEVAHYRIQTPGDFLDAFGEIQNPVPNAQTDVFDFLTLLVDALSDRGLTYEVASHQNTFDVELPMFDGAPTPPWSDLRLTESVAVLARVRPGLSTSNPDGDTYSLNLPLEDFGVSAVKGWAAVDVTLKDRTYRFVTTHLEPADVGPNHAVVPEIAFIQHAQAAELLGTLEDVSMPVILTGDLNSESDGSSTDSYAMMSDAGFIDTWLVGSPRGDGFTANQEADLLNADSELWHRIDLVLYRDGFTAEGLPFRSSVHAERLGEAQEDRTESGLWPSDHAGVRTTLRTAQKP